jgi:hypothetical protein
VFWVTAAPLLRETPACDMTMRARSVSKLDTALQPSSLQISNTFAPISLPLNCNGQRSRHFFLQIILFRIFLAATHPERAYNFMLSKLSRTHALQRTHSTSYTYEQLINGIVYHGSPDLFRDAHFPGRSEQNDRRPTKAAALLAAGSPAPRPG